MVVDGTPIALSMREGYRQHRLTEAEIEETKKKDRYFYGRYRYEPTGKLELKVDSSEACFHQVWREGKVALEDQLSEILGAFMHAPIEAKRIAEVRRREELKRREAEEKSLEAKAGTRG